MNNLKMAQTYNNNDDWNKYTLDQLGQYINGRAFKKQEWKKQGLPIIRIQNLNNPSAGFNYTDNTHEDKYRVKNGDLLVSWAASLGVYVWDRGDAWLNQHIFKVLPNEKLVTKAFLRHLLESVLNKLYAKTHGTGMVHITKGDFDSQEVYIPGIPEQEVIVKNFSIMFPLVDATQTNVHTAKLKLLLFRQAIISAAVTGKLTEQWRETHDLKENNILSLIEENINNLNKSNKKKLYCKVNFQPYEFNTDTDYPDSWKIENIR
jgi:type I restriction enzyme, S subunit